MAPKSILGRAEAVGGLIKGIDMTARIVGLGYGPGGRNVVIERDYGGRISKDGVSLARVMEHEERLIDVGAKFLKGVAVEMSDVAGDGTSLAVILAAEMIKEGLKSVAAGIPVSDLRLGITRALAVADKHLEKIALAADDDALNRVAETAAHGDIDVARLTIEALRGLGNDAFIAVEAGEGLFSELVHENGIRIEQGLISSEFLTGRAETVRVLEEPVVLVTDHALSALAPMIPLLDEVYTASRSLLIIAGEVSGEALSTLLTNDRSGALNVVAVRAPKNGHRRTEMLIDIAMATGARFISFDQSMRIDDVRFTDLGQAGQARVDKNLTRVSNGNADLEAVRKRSETLRARRDTEASEFERADLARSLSWLHGKSTLLKVGGLTQDEIKERRDRAVNCVQSVKAASSSGVLPGGGKALLHAKRAIAQIKPSNEGEMAGIAVVSRALEKPAKLIGDHNDGNGAYAIAITQEKFGDDLALGEGPVDPSATLRLALAIAGSAAKVAIATEYVVLDR